MRSIDSRLVVFPIVAAALTVCAIGAAIVGAALLPGDEEHGTHDPSSHDEFATYLPLLQESADTLHAIGARSLRDATAIHRFRQRDHLPGYELALNAERRR